jgi:hypothetical protein
MLKNFFSLVFIALSVACYGQKSTLFKNINYRAEELSQNLNKEGDSLFLSCEKTIYKVVIFNDDFDKTIKVRSKKIDISLHDIPQGEFVVETRIPNKRIIMTLVRHEEFTSDYIEGTDTVQSLSQGNKDLTKAENTSQQQLAQGAEIEGNKRKGKEGYSGQSKRRAMSVSNMLNSSQKQKNTTNNKIFWISYVVNSGTSSRKTMKMMRQHEVDKLINRLKRENKTEQGKLNTLTVWEIYDSRKFLKAQLSNPNYINSKISDYFNVIPFYSSETDKELVALN